MDAESKIVDEESNIVDAKTKTVDAEMADVVVDDVMEKEPPLKFSYTIKKPIGRDTGLCEAKYVIGSEDSKAVKHSVLAYTEDGPWVDNEGVLLSHYDENGLIMSVMQGEVLTISEYLKKMSSAWRYDYDNHVIGFTYPIQKQIMWLFKAVYNLHDKDDYNGDILTHARFMLQSEVVVFAGRTHLSGETVKDGIKKDLVSLGDFIQAILANKPWRQSQKVQPFENKSFLNTFLEMCKAENLEPTGKAAVGKTVDDLKRSSYFVCHTSMVWGARQRQVYCSAFYHFKEQHVDFDSIVSFRTESSETNSGNLIRYCPDDWRTPIMAINPSDHPVRDLLLTKEDRYKTRYSIIPFHRSCYMKVNDESTKSKSKSKSKSTTPFPIMTLHQIDELLLTTLPHAIHIAWYNFYKELSQRRPQLIDDLKADPYCIDLNNEMFWTR